MNGYKYYVNLHNKVFSLYSVVLNMDCASDLSKLTTGVADMCTYS